jgi:hypothetical protein
MWRGNPGKPLIAFVAALLVSMSACTNITQLQKPTSDLGTAITAAADAQQALYDNENRADANRVTASSRQLWLLQSTNTMTASAGKAQLAAEIEKRTGFLKSVRLYGQLMTAIATGTQDATLDANATALENSLQALQKNSSEVDSLSRQVNEMSPKGAQVNIGDVIATAIDSLGKVVIDHASAHEVQQAAKSIEPALKEVIPLFGKENGNIIASIASDNKQIDNVKFQFEHAVWSDKASTVGQKYLSSLQIEGDFAKLLVPASGTPMADAWDSVQKANTAVASQQGDFFTEIQEAKDRAQNAAAFYKGAGK